MNINFSLGAFITFLCGSISMNMDKYSNLLIIVTSFVQFVTLYISVLYNSIYVSYINYIIFCTIYQGMMTIARLDL
jgi:hypothetical protein